MEQGQAAEDDPAPAAQQFSCNRTPVDGSSLPVRAAPGGKVHAA